MSIDLIAKIAPKNSGFTGMVDANQVIGTSGGATTSYLPSSAISANSLTEPYFKISNNPTDGYYLQWKDSTDKLTWTEVVGGTDVAWSGAYQYYALSSNLKQQVTSLYNASTSAKSLYAPSRSVNNGLSTITAGSGAITHGLIATPNYWNVRPSGNINFGITTRVDATKIYVQLTTPSSRGVYWYAST